MKLAKIAKFDSLIELLDAFPDEESCIIYLEHLRWPNKVKSPFYLKRFPDIRKPERRRIDR